MVNNILDTSNLESRKIITEMSKLLNKLQISTNCQTLHSRLKHYLKLVTAAKTDSVLAKTNEMESKLLDGGQNRNDKKNFVFTSPELSDNLEDKASVLKGLLNKYQHLPDQCKPRALPLKEYIEHHLSMLSNMLSEDNEKNAPSSTEERENEQSTTKSQTEVSNELLAPLKHRSIEKSTSGFYLLTVSDEKLLVEEQLENLGLGKKPHYKPNFDLDSLISQNRHRKDTLKQEKNLEYAESSIGKSIRKRHSEEYEKLLNAINKAKLRRIRETRLGEMYGKSNDDLFNTNKNSNQYVNDFESPAVYSF